MAGLCGGPAFLTSRLGIAGTVLGAAITVMLITAGSSIIEAYLEKATRKARIVPSNLRGRVGSGVRLFEHIDPEHVELEKTRVIDSSKVTHLRYRAVR